MMKLVGWKNDGETAYQLVLQAKHTWLKESWFNLLQIKIDFCSEKQK